MGNRAIQRSATQRTLRMALSDRPFIGMVALFVLLSFADLALENVGIHRPRFTTNLLFHLLTDRNVVAGSLIWAAATLLAIANMVITCPAVPTWARREALLFCLLITLAFGSDI